MAIYPHIGRSEHPRHQRTPVGTVVPYISITSLPAGWLLCSGQTVSRTDYPTLFRTIGTTFGAGDGSTTFTLPDLRGRTIIGAGAGAGLTSRAVGARGGAETHTLSENEIPRHNHRGTTETAGSHNHSSNCDGGRLSLSTYTGEHTMNGSINDGPGEPDLYANPVALNIQDNGAHQHDFTTSFVGSGDAHNNMQPFLSLAYIIRARP